MKIEVSEKFKFSSHITDKIIDTNDSFRVVTLQNIINCTYWHIKFKFPVSWHAELEIRSIFIIFANCKSYLFLFVYETIFWSVI